MALEGNLQDMSLIDLIHIFRMGPKSGVLLLADGSEHGILYVSEGRLIDSVVVRGPEQQVVATAEEAVIQLLQWESATFTFRHDPGAVVERPTRIFHDSEWLVLEGIRRRKSPLQGPSHQRITMDSQLELASLPNQAKGGVNLDLTQWRILSQIAVSQNIRDICDNTGLEQNTVIRTVTELVAIGLVEVTNMLSPRPVKPKPVKQQDYNPSSLTPVPAGSSAVSGGVSTTTSSRGLLNAIMRRVRGL